MNAPPHQKKQKWGKGRVSEKDEVANLILDKLLPLEDNTGAGKDTEPGTLTVKKMDSEKMKAGLGTCLEKVKARLGTPYFPSDSGTPPPPKEIKKLVEYYVERKLELLTGCDANSHHTV